MWWCATGPLAFLPIHAAGYYDNEVPGTKLSDFAISSYIPSLTSILKSTVPQQDNFKLVAVTQPELPCAEEEWKLIQKWLGNLSNTHLSGADATVERVLEEMKKCNWVHLACHGTQNTNAPTNSAFHLHQGDLTLSKIIQLSLPNADFAFLSACATSQGEESLSEEAVHLAAGMILAGYRGVISTMWPIKDDLAPYVADAVYTTVLDDGKPDRTKAAGALHKAVQELRKQPGLDLLSWVPFVHFGD